MDSIRSISCKLLVEQDQAKHITDTMSMFAHACNFIADYGRKHRVSQKFALQKAIDPEVRERFGLSANLAVRAIARVAACLAKAKTRKSAFKPTSVDYDVRIFSLNPGDWTVSVRLLDRRERFALNIGDWQRNAFSGANPTCAVLCRRGFEFYINIQVKESIPDPDEPTGVLGVDLGIKDIATMSDGESFGGEALNAYRLKRHKVCKSLQANAHTGSRTARKNVRRAVKRLSGKERRYQKDLNHRISKHITETAKANGQAIALEDLKGSRPHEQATPKIPERSAQSLGVIDPRYTSQTCSSCHHLGRRRRKSFSCSNCGCVVEADLNGAIVIAVVGASVIMPEISTPFVSTIAAEVG